VTSATRARDTLSRAKEASRWPVGGARDSRATARQRPKQRPYRPRDPPSGGTAKGRSAPARRRHLSGRAARVRRSRRSVLSGGLRHATDGQFHLINRAHACDARHRAPRNTRVGRGCRCTRITRGRNRMPPVEFYCGTPAPCHSLPLGRKTEREREREPP